MKEYKLLNYEKPIKGDNPLLDSLCGKNQTSPEDPGLLLPSHLHWKGTDCNSNTSKTQGTSYDGRGKFISYIPQEEDATDVVPAPPEAIEFWTLNCSIGFDSCFLNVDDSGEPQLYHRVFASDQPSGDQLLGEDVHRTHPNNTGPSTAVSATATLSSKVVSCQL